MAIFTQARRRGQMLSNRRRNVTGGPKPPVPGQTPPILRPNQQPGPGPTPGPTQGPVLIPPAGGTNPAAPLPTLNHNQRQMVKAIPNFGSNAFNEDALRRLMRQGLAAGLGNGAVNRFANPAFLRAASDPFGGAQTLKGLTPDQLRTLSQVSKGMTGQFGAVTGNQAAIFDALPELQQKYAAMANSYKVAPDVTNGMSTTPPNAQLGSDGKYHDPNQPLPPGVTLDAPEGATAPLTQPIAQIAEAGHGTPQSAINAGKDPTKHQAYWAEKGWVYNEATDQWTNKNQPTTPGQTPPINVPGGITPGAGATVPAQAGAASPQMPLDPAYIAAQRAAQLQLNSTLQGVNPALEQIDTQNQVALARMQTNAGVDTQNLMEALSARGALQSSIYGTERGNLATNYSRMGYDLAADVANAQSQVFQQQQGAYNDYYASLIEALLSSAASSATSQYTPVGRPNRKPKKKPKKKRGNNRGGS